MSDGRRGKTETINISISTFSVWCPTWLPTPNKEQQQLKLLFVYPKVCCCLWVYKGFYFHVSRASFSLSSKGFRLWLRNIKYHVKFIDFFICGKTVSAINIDSRIRAENSQANRHEILLMLLINHSILWLVVISPLPAWRLIAMNRKSFLTKPKFSSSMGIVRTSTNIWIMFISIVGLYWLDKAGLSSIVVQRAFAYIALR